MWALSLHMSGPLENTFNKHELILRLAQWVSVAEYPIKWLRPQGQGGCLYCAFSAYSTKRQSGGYLWPCGSLVSCEPFTRQKTQISKTVFPQGRVTEAQGRKSSFSHGSSREEICLLLYRAVLITCPLSLLPLMKSVCLIKLDLDELWFMSYPKRLSELSSLLKMAFLEMLMLLNKDHSSKINTHINYNMISFSSPPACYKALTDLWESEVLFNSGL